MPAISKGKADHHDKEHHKAEYRGQLLVATHDWEAKKQTTQKAVQRRPMAILTIR